MTKDDTRGWAWLLVAAGYLQGSALLLVGLAADLLPGARGAVGIDVVTSGGFQPWGVVLTALALASFLGCAFVWLGHAYGLVSLVAAGAAGTFVLAMLGSWVALVVPVAMAVGLLLVLTTPALDHVAPAERHRAEGT